MNTLRDVIKETTKQHLDKTGMLYAQCVQAVGWIGGTVPNDAREGSIIELPTSDVSNAGVVVGCGLAGRRPVYVIRYQGFLTYNGASIFNYGCKSKAMWQTPCPVFVRAIAMEGSIGPVASNYHHSTAIRSPGTRVHAPITPSEWLYCWETFMNNDDPMYCSEHRKTFDFVDGATDTLEYLDNASDCTIIGVGYARIAALEAARELGFNFGRIHQLKPLRIDSIIQEMIMSSDYVFVVDGDHEYCGASSYICSELMKTYRRPKCLPIGLDDRTAGFSPYRDNLTPSTKNIINKIKRIV